MSPPVYVPQQHLFFVLCKSPTPTQTLSPATGHHVSSVETRAQRASYATAHRPQAHNGRHQKASTVPSAGANV
ncbi:unnamed protein product [Tilletia laevis]|nr:unnamed protein product [Tilletia laevis]CAD6958233.1 unnamed protein product [Tilletia caries]